MSPERRYIQRHDAILRRCVAYIAPGADLIDGGYVFHRVRGDGSSPPFNALIVPNDDGSWSVAVKRGDGSIEDYGFGHRTAGQAIRFADYALTCGDLGA